MAEANRLVIEIPYGGFGDHLFHSHLPRIAKETERYSSVYISNKSIIRQKDHLKLIWELNPFVDGFVDEAGLTCDLGECVLLAENSSTHNLLDYVMFKFGLNDHLTYHEPELYYKPKFSTEYKLTIFDPNHHTYVGDFNVKDLYYFLKKKNLEYSAVMKLRGAKSLYIHKESDLEIDAPDVFSFCDVINSSKEIICFTSGTATLAAAMKKKAIVIYGDNVSKGFHHSRYHDYIKIEKCYSSRIKDIIKLGLNFLKIR